MDTFLLGVLVEYPNIINRINNKTKGKKCVVTNNVTVTLVPVIPVNVDKEYLKIFWSPLLWFIGIVILLILAW